MSWIEVVFGCWNYVRHVTGPLWLYHADPWFSVALITAVRFMAWRSFVGGARMAGLIFLFVVPMPVTGITVAGVAF
jgi:hypothetical protein